MEQDSTLRETKSSTNMRVTNVPAIIVGIVAILTSLLGILYSVPIIIGAARGVFEPMLQNGNEPYFYPAFYTMSGICVACYLILFVCGIDLVRSRLRWVRLVTLILLFEVGYFFAVGSLWLEPTIGRSVGAATGVSNGGMMAQYIILFPMWGPLLLWWSKVRDRQHVNTMNPASLGEDE